MLAPQWTAGMKAPGHSGSSMNQVIWFNLPGLVTQMYLRSKQGREGWPGAKGGSRVADDPSPGSESPVKIRLGAPKRRRASSSRSLPMDLGKIDLTKFGS